MIIGNEPAVRPTPLLSVDGSGMTSSTAGPAAGVSPIRAAADVRSWVMAGDPAPAVSSVGPVGPRTMAPSADRSASADRAADSSPTTVTSNASGPAD